MQLSNALLFLSLLVAGAQASPLPHKRMLRKKSSSCVVRPASSSALAASGSGPAFGAAAFVTVSSSLAVSPSASSASPTSSTSAVVGASSSTSSSTPTSASTTSAVVTTSATPTTTSTSTTLAPTTTSQSTAAAATTTADSSSSGYTSGWTSDSAMYPQLSSVSLSTILAATKGKAGSYSDAPDGSNGMIATYQAGTYGTGVTGSWSYYANYNNAKLNAATEVELTYSVYFQSGFQFALGGKLPGLYGGEAGVYECSGGDQTTRDACFSMRLMFRQNGAGELYTYLPETTGNVASCKATDGVCNQEVYGLSFGRGKWTWATGQWVTIKEHVRLNDVGQSNGFVTMTYNGNVAFTASNLEIRTTSTSGFQGIMMSTFFGGSDSSYDSPITQSTWFKDFSVGIIA